MPYTVGPESPSNLDQSRTVFERPSERAFIVGVDVSGSRSLWSIDDSLNELQQLARTAGITVTGKTFQRLPRINPKTYIGSGKVEELFTEIASEDIQTVIFNDELSPGQQRNLEQLLGDQVKIIDRTALILDIFAQHAHTREGQIQVELAQYEYRLPRLTRLWTHLVRQAGGRAGGASGGVGLRGPGETQLESDRRQIRRKIASLKRDLEEIRRHRNQHYRQRKRKGIKTVALVGYTNAGKSSLLNVLSAKRARNRLKMSFKSNALSSGGFMHRQPAEVLKADQLFATLDPTTRRVRLPKGTIVLLTDTVGFINKLPHNLVAAFRATLEGIAQADLLLHIADINHAKADAQIEAVNRELANLGVAGKPTLLVWNKIDLAQELIKNHYHREDGLIAVSALTGSGIPKLLKKIERMFNMDLVSIEVELPYSDGSLKSKIYEQGAVEWFRYGPSGTRIRAHVPPMLFNALKPYQCLKKSGK